MGAQRGILGLSNNGIFQDRGRFGIGTELPISAIDIMIQDGASSVNDALGITLRNIQPSISTSVQAPPFILQASALDTNLGKYANFSFRASFNATSGVNSSGVLLLGVSKDNGSYLSFIQYSQTSASISGTLTLLSSGTYPSYITGSGGFQAAGAPSNTQTFRIGGSIGSSTLFRYTNGGSSIVPNAVIVTASGNSGDLGYAFDGNGGTQKGLSFLFSNGTTYLAGAYAVLTNLVTTAGSEKADLSWYWNPGGTTPTLSMVMNDDLQLTGFLYRSASYLRVQTQFDKTANTTLGDITNLSATVKASGKYIFEAVLFYDADAVGGQKYAVGGTCTATSIIYSIESINNATNVLVITSRQTALAGSAGQAGSTSGICRISGVIVVNAAGTLTVQFAQNAANGTSSILAGSYFKIDRIS